MKTGFSNPAVSLTALVVLVLASSGCNSDGSNDGNGMSSDPPVVSVLDFETLTSNAFLHEQDNWIDAAGSGQAVVSLDGSTVNGTQIVEPLLTTALNAPVYLSRQNDQRFAFVGFSSDGVDEFIQFDLTAEGSAMMALGRDIDGDAMLNAAAGEIGPGFGIVNGQFRLQGAANGQLHEAEPGLGNAVSDWYRLRLILEVKPSAGGIVGSLYYRNLTKGDLAYLPIAGLQAIDLESERLHADANPDAWTSISIYLQTGAGRTPGIDNLVPHGKQDESDD